ncbi:MAG TPA: response regulator transcription factor [Steroidobacteraceae bacterium]|jgi:DNA-binding NarL/FixJ family response regulator
MIRVCLADDQALFRSGLRALLDLFDEIDVVAEAEDGEAAVGAVLASKPDVLLLDVRMPKLNGIEVLKALQAREILPPTLLLTTFEDDAALVEGVKAGARGYLLKGVSPETLLEAVRTVASGQSYLYAPLIAELARDALSARQRDDKFEMIEALTPREAEILKLMASGIGNRAIADALSLSEGTVKNHVSSVFAKLGVVDRTNAVLRAIAKGLV